MQLVKQWRVTASKTPDVYIVKLFDDGHFECDCKGYTYADKHFCKHTQTKRLDIENVYLSVGVFIKMLKEYEGK